MGRRKSQFRRMSKAERGTLIFWAEGCREEILTPHVAPYADALARSHIAERDYLSRVQDEYYQLIPWDLPDDEEPPLPLAKYNPSLIAPSEVLSLERQQLKSQTIGRKNHVCFTFCFNSAFSLFENDSMQLIQRWLKYRVRKLTFNTIEMNPEKNPYTALLAKLSGVVPPPIRARQGWQQLMHKRMDLVTPAVSAAWSETDKAKEGMQENIEQGDAGGKAPRNNVGFRAEVVCKLFQALPKHEQQQFTDSAKRDKEKAVSDYKEAVERSLSSNRSPEARQL